MLDTHPKKNSDGLLDNQVEFARGSLHECYVAAHIILVAIRIFGCIHLPLLARLSVHLMNSLAITGLAQVAMIWAWRWLEDRSHDCICKPT